MATTWTTDTDDTITVTAGSSSTSNSWTTDGSTKGTIATSGESSSFTNLVATGTLDVTGATTLGDATLKATSTGKPDLTIQCTNSASLGGMLIFSLLSTSPADNDTLGAIHFNGYNDASAGVEYARIVGKSKTVASSGDLESGELLLGVITKNASFGAFYQTGLKLSGSTTDDEVDVTIANGAASMTTVAGDLTVTGNDIASSSETALSLSGNDVEVKGELTVTGNNIKSSTGATAIALSGANITGQGVVNATTSFVVGNSTLNTSSLSVASGNFTIDVVSGDLEIDVDSGNVTLKDNTSAFPNLVLETTENGTTGPSIKLTHVSATPDEDDIIGIIDFIGNNTDGDAEEPEVQHSVEYAKILGQVINEVDSAERGRLTLKVMTKTAIQPGLILNGTAVSNEVDAIIGNGAASITTVAGELAIAVAGNRIDLDGVGGHTSIRESGDGIIMFEADATDLLSITENPTQASQIMELLDDMNLKVGGSAYFESQIHQDHTTGGLTVDWNTSNKQSVDVTGTGYTLTMTNPGGPCNLILKVIQGNGDDEIDTWAASSGSVYWAGGAAPTLSTANGAIDIISLYFDGTNYFGMYSTAFATV